MSNELWGVLIGGLLASIVPIVTLVTEGRRWKRDQRLEFFKAERSRKEALYARILESLGDAMSKNSYPSQITSEIMVSLPKSASDRFQAWMKEKPKDELKTKHAYYDMCLLLKQDLADLDSRMLKHIS